MSLEPDARVSAPDKGAEQGSRPLHILMVHGWWDSTNAGGVITVIRTLHDNLSSDHRVSLLINDWGARGLERGQEDGIECFRVRLRPMYDPGHPIRSMIAWCIYLPITLRNLRRLLVNEQVDVVHLHYPLAYQIYFPILKTLFGTRYIITAHGTDIAQTQTMTGIQRRIMQCILGSAETVVSVSPALAEEIGRIFPELTNVKPIPNGIPAAEIGRVVQQAAPDPDLPARYFAVVGHLRHIKGQDIAIRAWAKVAHDYPGVKLVLVGDGDDRAALEELARSEVGSDQVVFVGHVGRDTALRIIHRAVGVLAPSRREGLGLVLLEAGAADTPVICSDIPPFRHLEHDRTALVVPGEDPTAVAEAVARLLDDQELCDSLARELHEHVRRNFDVNRMVENYERLFATVTG